MTINFTCWNHWEAVRCCTAQLELIVGVSSGPRILSLSYNGDKNLLYEDHTNFSVGEWRIHGGHRFTTAPENAESYHPDNDPCEVRITESSLEVSAKQRTNGLKLSLEITESSQGGFDIKHVLLNNGSGIWEGALWSITCVPRSARVSAACSSEKINFWPGTDDSKWEQANGQLRIADGDFRAKAGWYSAYPELVALEEQGKFIISSTDKTQEELCVDNNSNVEIFVCADFAELETLSEKLLVAPGRSATHLQHWQFLPS